ncbi:lysylphosphatidylglycerol synthase domain-containing protein (plasmid) [Rhizobium sp. T1470]|uniref:lysylphosphatidylglycerol synthase domain-containing protein n=1 Tax=unclassified Rhizobium TaxID=2613769 RepID=UPI001AAF2CA7|nr:lysylphosphatidylglycerol synthase domain-containing protein [Rhizobium sp. T1473]MCA0805740.1 lysylphosphatidylglycerol synthase domain-containing protein [Rhizobium sp. T1473]
MSVRRVFINTALILGLLLAAYLLYKVFSRYSLGEIMLSLGAISASRFVLAVGFCALSYLCLSGFDWMALRYAGKPLSYPKAALASFTSLSIGHNLGVAALSSGAVRYRYYARWGLNAEEVAKVILFCGVTVGMGLSTLAGIALLSNPRNASKLLRVGADTLFWLGLLCLAFPVFYVVLAGTLRAPLHVWKWRFEMPDLKLAIGQIIIGTLNFICVAACLHQVLTASVGSSFVQTATAYVLANIAVLVTHVPGGLGVLEATVSHVLPGAASIGALVAFRVIYFLLPLLIGLTVFAASELVLRKRSAARSKERAQKPSQTQTQLL